MVGRGRKIAHWLKSHKKVKKINLDNKIVGSKGDICSYFFHFRVSKKIQHGLILMEIIQVAAILIFQ